MMQDKIHHLAQTIKDAIITLRDATIPLGTGTTGVGLWAWLGVFFHPVAISLMFLMKEHGELKYKIDGKYYSLEKQKQIWAETFRPVTMMQWALPGVAAAAVVSIT